MTIEQRAIIRRILSEEYIRNLDRAREYQCKGFPGLAWAYLSRAEKILRLLEELDRA
jgi:hypothetical protein